MTDTPLADALFEKPLPKESRTEGRQAVVRIKLTHDDLRTLERDARAAAEAKLAQVQEWRHHYNEYGMRTDEDLDAILAKSDTSALDAVRADGAKQALNDLADYLTTLSNSDMIVNLIRARAAQTGATDAQS